MAKLISMVRALHDAIHQGKLDDARALVEDLPDSVRQDLTRPIPGVVHKGALFKVIESNRPEFVEFLVNTCHADMKVKHEFDIHEGTAKESGTPLTFAVILSLLEVVKQLVNLGANVHFVTPVEGNNMAHLAAYAGNVEILDFLFQSGVDLKAVNKSAESTLMVAVRHVDVCRYLLSIIPECVNNADENGNTALHHCVELDCIETMEFLLKNGADPSLKNINGNDAIQECIMSNASSETFFLLLRHSQNTGKNLINIFLLRGACLAEKFDNTEEAFQMWRRSCLLRDEFNIRDDVISVGHPAYDMAVEIDSEAKLDKIKNDHNKVIMHALLLKEKILGPTSYWHIVDLSSRVEYYRTLGDHSRALRLLSHTFELSRLYNLGLDTTSDGPFFEDHSCEYFQDHFATLKLDEFESLLNFLQTAIEWASNRPIAGRVSLRRLANSMPYLIYALCRTKMNEGQELRFKKQVYKAVKVNVRGRLGCNMLGAAIDLGYRGMICDRMIRVLVECGANVSETDSEGNTILLKLAFLMSKKRNELSELDNERLETIARFLAASGAHVDATNVWGRGVTDYVPSLGTDLSEYVTLKCLAARAIISHRIPFEGRIPESFCDFVKLH